MQEGLESTLLEVEPVEQAAPGEADSKPAAETELAYDDSDFGLGADDGNNSDGSDTEFLAAIAQGPRPVSEPELPSTESLFELDADDDDMAI